MRSNEATPTVRPDGLPVTPRVPGFASRAVAPGSGGGAGNSLANCHTEEVGVRASATR